MCSSPVLSTVSARGNMHMFGIHVSRQFLIKGSIVKPKQEAFVSLWDFQQQTKAAASYAKAAFEVERQEKLYIIFYKACYKGSLYTH